MLPVDENIYETDCPILYAMKIIGQKWKLPILWYIADAENQTIRYKELERRVVGITATMLTKCLRELEADKLIHREQHNTIPPTVEYSLIERKKITSRQFSGGCVISGVLCAESFQVSGH